MGAKQGLEVLTPLVESFRNDARVHFLFCGDGVYRQELERLIRGKANVTMMPLQPHDRLNELLNAADVHLLPQMGGVADLVMPSKLTGILASGRPVIAMADEGTQVAEVGGGMRAGRSDGGTPKRSSRPQRGWLRVRSCDQVWGWRRVSMR